MAAQSAVAGLGVVIGSAIAFSWKSTDALDMERQRAMRHSMSGKVRLRTRDTSLYLHTPKFGNEPVSEKRTSYTGPFCIRSWLCIGLARTHTRPGWPASHLPVLTSLAGSSPQYSEGDDELIKHVQRRASSFTPESPEQILQMQQMRHEFTGKLVPRMTENC